MKYLGYSLAVRAGLTFLFWFFATVFLPPASAKNEPESGFELARFEDSYKAVPFRSNPSLEFNSFKGFSRRGFAEDLTGIYLLEPVDPDKIPVLFIHGLLSEPGTWKKMVDALLTEPDITSRFQFWFYAYPSATPVVPSAGILKLHLDEAVRTVEQEFGISMNRRLIVVGHSMGGMLTKSLISSTGDRLWDSLFTAPVSEFNLTEEQRRLLDVSFRYEPRDYVKTAVFISTPHRGSALANSPAGRFGARISARPVVIENLAKALVHDNHDRLTPEFRDFVANKVNSISTLRPDSPVTGILADLPVDKAVTFHTIAGIKKGPLASLKKSAGDGIVPLSSTDISGATCEVGVYSSHSAHLAEETISIMASLLRLHAQIENPESIIKSIKAMDLPFARYHSRVLIAPAKPSYNTAETLEIGR